MAQEAEVVLGGRPYVGITDPVYVPPANPGPLERFGLSLIRDPKDLPFLGLSLAITFIVIPSAAFLFWPGHLRADGTWSWLTWGLAVGYLLMVFLGFLDRYILMLHNTSHRVLFKNKALNHYIPWVLGPFMGETPETYFSHHIGMHHFEGNLEPDLSSTMRYQRDKVAHFAHYYFKFMALTIIELPIYLAKKNRKRLAFNAVGGEALFYVVVGSLAYFNWRAALIVFVVPYLTVRFLMMCGNWGQHAFIDPARPDNSYVNSITCINARYNRRAFNDGYHIGHHLKQVRHYSDMPTEFMKNVDRYAAEGAIVFEGIDFFMVWLYLMLGRYDWLAQRYVRLDATPRTQAQIEELLRSRIQPCVSLAAPAAAQGGGEPATA